MEYVRRRVIVWFVLLLIAHGARVGAQQAQGSLTGTVTDPSDAVVPGVTVTAVEKDTGFSRSAVSSRDGTYIIPLLAPGNYTITAEKQGFETYNQGPIPLTVNQHPTLDIQLKVGAQTTTVSVEAAVPVLDTQSASVGTTVEQAKVSQLPFNGRHFLEATLFTPGVVPGSEGSELNETGRGGSINVNGLRETMNTFLLDGMSNTSVAVGTYVVTPPLDSIQEFRMETGVYDARFGTNAGAQVNVVTKSGTNQVHGSLYEYLRNNKLDTRNFFEPTVPAFHRNQFGASLGGPIVFPHIYNGHDRTFFFLNYEGLRDLHSFFSRSHVPTEAERSGDFSDIASGSACSSPTILLDPLVLFNPAFPLTVPNNNVAVLAESVSAATGGMGPFPLGTVDPVGQALANFYPSPNVANAPCGAENYTAVVTQKIYDNNYVGRFDHRWGTKDTIFYRYNLTTDSEFVPSGLPGSQTLVPGFGTKRADWFDATGLDWTHAFTPSLLNEAKIAYNRWQYRWSNQDQGQLVAKQLGINGVPQAFRDTGVPNLTFSGYDPLGANTSYPQAGAVNTFEFADTLTQIHGNHSLAYGFDIKPIKRGNFFLDKFGRSEFDFTGSVTGQLVLGGIALNALNPQNPAQAAYQQVLAAQVPLLFKNSQGAPCLPSSLGGAADCAPIANLGNGLGDAMFGIPSDWLDGFSGYVSGTGTEYDYFAQDNWKARRNLTVTLGVRYEYNSLVTDKADHFGSFDFSKGLLLVAGRSAASLYNFAGAANTASGNPIGAFVPAGTESLGGTSENRSLQRPDRNNFGPRIGFAWQPGSSAKTVVRGGYGMYFDQMVGQLYFQKSFNPPFFQLLSGDLVDNESAVFQALQTPPPLGGLPQGTGLFIQNAFVSPKLAGALFPTLNPVKINLDDSTIHQWAFDVQRELPGSWLVDVAYVGTRGLHLPFLWDPNQPNNSDPTACSPACPRLYGNFRTMEYTDSIGTSTYHALQVKIERHYSRGLAVIGAYTYSKTIDSNSTYFSTDASYNFPQDSYNRAAEKGLADFDHRQRFSLAYVYDLPFGNTVAKLENSRLNYLIQGWQLSGVAMVETGAPFTPFVDGNPSGNLDGSGGAYPGKDRPDRVSGVPLYPATKSVNQWINPAAFVPQALLHYGTAGRDILIGPRTRSWDFSLIRKFRLTESKALEFRAEMFNIFNQANFTLPDSDISHTTFGVIPNTVQPIAGQASGGPGDPREIQFALRFTW